MQSRPSRSAQRGMILTSMVLYHGIIAILIGLLLPAVQAARESGRALQQQEETRALGARVVAEADATEELVASVEDALEREENAFRTLAPRVHDQILRLRSLGDDLQRAASTQRDRSFQTLSNVAKAKQAVDEMTEALQQVQSLFSHADEQRN